MEIDLDEPTRPQIAAVLGVSSRWIGELRAKGDLPPDGSSLLENVEAWAQAKYGIDGVQDALDLDAESARLKKEQADSKAMDNAERRGELASLPDMSGAVVSVIALAVTRLQQVGLTPAAMSGTSPKASFHAFSCASRRRAPSSIRALKVRSSAS